MIYIKLDVPYSRQKTRYTCGETSIQMLLAFLGKKRIEKQLTKEAEPTKRYGTTHQAMIQTARKEGYYVHVQEGSTIHHLHHYLQEGYPVLIDYEEPSSNEGHYALIIGSDNNHFIMNDPWNGKNFTITHYNFSKRWHDRHEKMKCQRWTMILSKQPINSGKTYTPIRKK